MVVIVMRTVKFAGVYLSVRSKNCVYLIKQLRAQGLSADSLTIIFNSLIISRIMYAAPAYSGLLSAHDKLRIASFLKKMKCFVYHK